MNEVRRDLERLVQARANPSVSIYLPVVATGRAPRKNSIRLKNALRAPVELLDVEDAQAFLRPIEQLCSGEDFWTSRTPGLAIFHTAEETGAYRLASNPEELTVVGRRFHVAPLIAMVGEPARFYVLALSRNATRLLEVTGDGARRIDAGGRIPASLAETVPAEGEKQLQFHSSGSGTPIYHGQGAGERREDEDLRRFLSAVCNGLRGAVAGGAPLVLAGVVELTAPFREVCLHDLVVAQSIEGNVESLSDDELAAQAHALAKPALENDRRHALEQIRALSHTQRATSNLQTIVAAAHEGRIDSLFVAAGAHRWGRFDEQTRSIAVDDRQSIDNEDLLDLAAVRSFENGGRVFVAAPSEIPAPGVPALALLRY